MLSIFNAVTLLDIPSHVYIAAGVFLMLCFLVCFFTRRKTNQQRKRKMAGRVLKTLRKIENAPQVMAYLKKIDPYAFEELLLDCFKIRGFKIIRNKRYSGDGGLDGKVIIQGHTFLIQAKRYMNHINPSHVHDLHKLCVEHQTYGLFVHTGKTGPMSKAHHHDRICMISGEMLVTFLKSKDQITLPLNEKHFIHI